MKEIKNHLLLDDSNFWAIGRMVESIKTSSSNDKITIFKTIEDIIANL